MCFIIIALFILGMEICLGISQSTLITTQCSYVFQHVVLNVQRVMLLMGARHARLASLRILLEMHAEVSSLTLYEVYVVAEMYGW